MLLRNTYALPTRSPPCRAQRAADLRPGSGARALPPAPRLVDLLHAAADFRAPVKFSVTEYLYEQKIHRIRPTTAFANVEIAGLPASTLCGRRGFRVIQPETINTDGAIY